MSFLMDDSPLIRGMDDECRGRVVPRASQQDELERESMENWIRARGGRGASAGFSLRERPRSWGHACDRDDEPKGRAKPG